MKALSPLRLLALPIVVLTVTPSCKENSQVRSDPDWWRLEGDRVEIAHEVDLLKLRLSNGENGSSDLNALSREVKSNVVRLEHLKATAGGLRQDISTAIAKTEAQRDNWMRTVRADAIGREFNSLAGARGRTYDQAVITRITDIGVEFRHSTGSARLSAADLTPAQHLAFGLDPVVAGQALVEEKAKAAAYDEWLGERILVANEAQERSDDAATELQAERAVASARAQTEAIKDRLASLELKSSRLRDEPRSVRNTYWSGSYGGRYSYSSRYRTNYYSGYYSSCGPRARYSTFNSPSPRTPVRPLNFSTPRARFSSAP